MVLFKHQMTNESTVLQYFLRTFGVIFCKKTWAQITYHVMPIFTKIEKSQVKRKMCKVK